MDFTHESHDRFVDWFVHNAHEISWVDSVDFAMRLIERDRWHRLRFDEMHVEIGFRRVIHTTVPGVHLIVDLVLDDDDKALVADFVNVFVDPDPPADEWDLA